MKHSLKNDKGLNATLPVRDPESMGIRATGPKSAPSEKLLDGQLVSFKNAEDTSVPVLKSYKFKE